MNTAYFRADGGCIGISESENSILEIAGAVHVVPVEVGVSPNSIWCDESGLVHPKNEFEVVISTNAVSNIPVGTRAHLPNQSIDVEDGVLEFEVNMPTTMMVILEHPHYMTKSIEVPCEG